MNVLRPDLVQARPAWRRPEPASMTRSPWAPHLCLRKVVSPPNSWVGDGSGLDAKGVGTVLEDEFVMGLDFVKNNFGAKLRKAGGKEGFTLLGVE